MNRKIWAILIFPEHFTRLCGGTCKVLLKMSANLNESRHGDQLGP